MDKKVILVLYALLMIAAIVAMDILFFRHHFVQRLVANIGAVLLFGTFYLSVLQRL